MKLSDSDRKYIIEEILGYTKDELQRINAECDDSECSWCRWRHRCLFDDSYLISVQEDLFR